MIGDDLNSDMHGAKNMGIIRIQKAHKGVVTFDRSASKSELTIDNYSQIINFFNENSCNLVLAST